MIWRALDRHVNAGHKLEVRRLPDGEDLEIHCCWCGGTVMAGSLGFMRQVVELTEPHRPPLRRIVFPGTSLPVDAPDASEL